jgi:predicted type IV restriction endonuclease
MNELPSWVILQKYRPGAALRLPKSEKGQLIRLLLCVLGEMVLVEINCPFRLNIFNVKGLLPVLVKSIVKKLPELFLSGFG